MNYIVKYRKNKIIAVILMLGASVKNDHYGQKRTGKMIIMDNITEYINFKITTETVLFFDMDGTLVDTDFANFLSYENAIKSVIVLDNELQFNPNERFNRTTLKTIAPNLSEIENEKIIQQKEDNYKKYLAQTKLNKSVSDILLQYFRTNKTVLVTNCRKDRALMTLNYHNLTDKFSNIFFRQIEDNQSRINKYKNAISSLSLSAQTVVVFENEKREIEDAILAGIPINNILSI